MAIEEILNPWDALDILERYEGIPDFRERWRGFLRDCALVLLPGLPPETQEWVSGADKFEAGQLSIEELTAIRVRAIRF